MSSSEVIPFYAEAFNMPEEKIYPLGIPRNDYFFLNDHVQSMEKNFYELYPELIAKKILLYAPTYRGKSHYQQAFRCPLDFKILKQHLTEEYALLIHLHPYMSKELEVNEEDKDFVYHIKDEFSIQELLLLADVLITDYSTVFFDYSLLSRPIVFFADDLDEYEGERDFYYRYESLIPGPFFNETEPLANWIKEGCLICIESISSETVFSILEMEKLQKGS